MELIRPDINIDFVGMRQKALLVSAVLSVLAILVVVVRGPHWGIDFSGGVMVHLRFTQAAPIDSIRGALRKINLEESAIQDFGGGGNEFLVRLPVEASQTQGASDALVGALEQEYGKDAFQVLRVEVVGPRVGSELRERALLSVIAATVMMGMYIALRFQWQFGVGAAVALFHDVILTVGALAIANYEFDLTVVAALLTIVGFSVNDTVIVSDRIRENMRKSRKETLAQVINRSINETLSRTVLTTGTAVFVVLSLFLLGGNVIHGFAFALLFGFIVGTYSSIFIASPVVLFFERSQAPARR